MWASHRVLTGLCCNMVRADGRGSCDEHDHSDGMSSLPLIAEVALTDAAAASRAGNGFHRAPSDQPSNGLTMMLDAALGGETGGDDPQTVPQAPVPTVPFPGGDTIGVPSASGVRDYWMLLLHLHQIYPILSEMRACMLRNP